METGTNALTIVYAGLILLALIILLSSVKVVPQRRAYIVERLGKYRGTLMAGFNIIVPFINKVRYKHTLKEQAIDVASQICITRDNISVEVLHVDKHYRSLRYSSSLSTDRMVQLYRMPL